MFNIRFRSIFAIIFIAGLLVVPTLAGAAGSGTCAVTPDTVRMDSEGATFTFAYAAAETMDGGGIRITVPEGWPLPQGDPGLDGYTTAVSTGSIDQPYLVDRAIEIPIQNLSAGQTITVSYGAGGGDSGVTVPAVPGDYGFQTESKLASDDDFSALEPESVIVRVIALFKSDLAITTQDTNLDQIIDEGDVFRVTVMINNPAGSDIARNVSFRYTPGEFVSVTPLSVQSTQGSVISDADPVEVFLGDIQPGVTAMVRFDVSIDGAPEGAQISFQGVVWGDNVPETLTDDPSDNIEESPAKVTMNAKVVNPTQYTGWWYRSMFDDGNGFGIEVQAGNPYGYTLFVAWFTYDYATGEPTWYTSGGLMTGDNYYSGEMRKWTGYPQGGSAGDFHSYPVGTINITFDSRERATFGWSATLGFARISGASSTIFRFMDDFFPGSPHSGNINGWWQDPAFEGTGVFVEAQGGGLFMAWFHYGDDSQPRWLSSGNTFTNNATLYQGNLNLWRNGATPVMPFGTPDEPLNAGAITVNCLPDQAIMNALGMNLTLRKWNFAVLGNDQ